MPILINGSSWIIWAIAAVATAGVILRPWRLPEAIWAVAGAVALVALGLLPWMAALRAIAKGTDVYLFLIGMMLLAELARKEGLFDWLAALAARLAGGSPRKLFVLVYLVGIVVTVFLSNDATAVVLTPAVYAVARAVKAPPLPYLLICAFIANAASFVLPISNPANLVIFGAHMPPLVTWLSSFALPSVLAILGTYVALYLTQRRFLAGTIETAIELPKLSTAGKLSALGIGLTALVLLGASAANLDLGLPTFLAGLATTAAILALERYSPWLLLRHISWSVLPLVAGLFVLVEGLAATGLIQALASSVQRLADQAPVQATWAVGGIVAVVCNLMNNLPAGLIAGSIATTTQLSPQLTSALAIGVDLGPNLSVTGSLATILWLVALRREGIEVKALAFLRLGVIVMPLALLLALGGVVLSAF